MSRTNRLGGLSALSPCSFKCLCRQTLMGIAEKSSTPVRGSNIAGTALPQWHWEHSRSVGPAGRMHGDEMEEPPNPRKSLASLLQAFLSCQGHQLWVPWMLLEAEHQPAGLCVEEKGLFHYRGMKEGDFVGFFRASSHPIEAFTQIVWSPQRQTR